MDTSRRRFLGIAAAGLGAGLASAPAAAASGRPCSTLYLGTYTSREGGGTGIGIASYDEAGRISADGVLTGVEDPSFLVLSASGRHLYAVNEQETGGVTAVAVDAPGKLRVLNRRTNGGSGPCHLALVANGKYLVSANYGSGDVAVHPVRSDGSLGHQTDLVKHAGTSPHAHQVLQDPSGRYVLAVDLGTDSVYTYSLAVGKLVLKSESKLKPGAGPRHLAFHPNGRYAYVANELDSTIAVCAYDPVSGRLTPAAALSTVPVGAPQNYPAEVIVSPDGRYVYLTNRGHNSIAVFAIEAGGAGLRLAGTPSCGGNWPRHCTLDPSGRLLFVSNQLSDTIVTFAVDRWTGGLTQTSTFPTPVPVCVLPA